MPYKVTFNYKLPHLPWVKTTMKLMSPDVGPKPHVHEFYSAILLPSASSNTKLIFYSTVHDSKGHATSKTLYIPSIHAGNTISLRLMFRTLMWVIKQHICEYHRRVNYSSKSSFAPLTGDPVSASLSFPLDRYSVDLVIKIPFKGVNIKNYTHYEAVYNSSWNPSLGQFTYAWNHHTNNTVLKVHMDFTRNDFFSLGNNFSGIVSILSSWQYLPPKKLKNMNL
ncbi:MAG: hypothetical protein WAM14_03865 [Candidatus Nitrosopolaris sp.]